MFLYTPFMDGHFLILAFYVLNWGIVKFVNDVCLLKLCITTWNTLFRKVCYHV